MAARILMKWNSMLVSNQSMGGYAEARYPAAGWIMSTQTQTLSPVTRIRDRGVW